MVKIPSYQREQLASSVVGTPGVDASGAAMFNSVAQAASTLSTPFLAQAKKRQDVADTSEAAKHLVDLKFAMDEDFNAHRSAYASNPTGSLEILKSKLSDRLGSTLNNIPSEAVRQMVELNGQTAISSQLNEGSTWVQRQLVSNSVSNINSTVNTLALQTNKLFEDQTVPLQDKVNKLQEHLLEATTQVSSAQGLLSPEQFAAFTKDTPDKIASGALYGAINKNPAEAVQLIDSGMFAGVLEPEKIAKFRRDAVEKGASVAKEAEFQQLSNAINTNQDFWKKAQSGELTLALVDGLDDKDPSKKVWRDIALKTNPMDDQQRMDELADLHKEYADLKVVKQKNDKPAKVKANLEQIVDFQQKVLDARARGVIDEAAADTFIKTLAVAKDKKEQVIIEKSQKSLAHSYTAIKKWSQRNGIGSDKFKQGRILNLAMQEYRNTGQRNIQEAVQSGIFQFMVEENPSLGLLAGTPNSLMKSDGREVAILPGQSRLKADTSIAKHDYVVKRDPVTGVSARVFPDGTFEVIK